MILKKYLQYINNRYSVILGRKVFKDERSLDNTLSGIAIVSLAFIAMSLYLKAFILIPAMVSPLIGVLLYPLLYAESKAEDYKKMVGDSAFVISVVTFVMTAIGKDIMVALRELAKRGNKVAETELSVLEKKVAKGESRAMAIAERAHELRGTPLAKLYEVYSDVAELGVSLMEKLWEYIEITVNDMAKMMENSLDLLLEMMEALLAMYLVPIVVISMSVLLEITSSINMSSLIVPSLLFPLLVSPLFYFLIARFSLTPRVVYKLTTKDKAVVIAGVIAMVVPSVVFHNSAYVSIAFGAIIASWFYNNYYRPAEILYDRLPLLASKVTDKVSLGYNFKNAVNELLNELAESDNSLKDVPYLVRKNVLAFMNDFITISELVYEGDPKLHTFISKIYSNLAFLRRHHLRRSMFFLAVSLAFPFVMYFELSMMSSVVNVYLGSMYFLIGIFTFDITLIFSKFYRGTMFFYPIYLVVGIMQIFLQIFVAHQVFF